MVLLRRGARRGLGIAVVGFSLVVAADPALAAKAPARTTISAHVTPATALVRTTAVVSGVVSPAGGPVALQRLEATAWVTVAHAKTGSAGGYTFTVRAPKAAASWTLRVVRAATSTTKGGVSASVHLRVVTQQFLVAAASASTLTSPATAVVTGVEVPATKGTVQVQQLAGRTWTGLATGKIGAGGTFSINTSLPVGPHKLRVVKAFTSSVAQGTSASFGVTVVAPGTGTGTGTTTAALAVTTAALTAARVGVPYAAVLTASGGNGFYAWTGTGLPGGLTLSAAGLLSGTPTGQGTTSFTVTVTDGAGHSASGSLSLTTAAPAGQLFAVGSNAEGELGNGTTIDSSLAVPVIGMTSVVGAAMDEEAAIAVKADGTVWTWGDNTYGELGNGGVTASQSPQRVQTLSDITAVASEGNTFLALRADGTVWAWGQGDVGALGDGTSNDEHSPQQIVKLSSVVAIGGTDGAGFALRSDGTVWSWGSNNGESVLGNGTTGGNNLPAVLPGLTNVTAIAIGGVSGYALRSGGTVFDWGSNTYGQLGNGGTAIQPTPAIVPGLPPVVQIASGQHAAYALSSTGPVYGWGDNGHKQLGTNSTTGSPSPATVHNLNGAIAVGASRDSAFAIASDRTMAVWGDNTDGQLGTGSAADQGLPVSMLGISGAIALGSGTMGGVMLVIAG